MIVRGAHAQPAAVPATRATVMMPSAAGARTARARSGSTRLKRRLTVRSCPARLASTLVAIVASLLAAHADDVASSDTAAALKLSVAAGPALPLGKVAERWAAMLSDDPAFAVPVKLHPGASLADRDAAREVEALQGGRADLAVGSALQWSLQVPSLAVYALPWIAPGRREIEALASSTRLFEAIATRLEARNLVLLAIAPLGHRELAIAARAVRAPDDVRGLRVRAPALPLIQDLLLALGARPQATSFAQAQAAFAKGELDAQEGLPTSLAASRVAASGLRHVTEWSAIADVMIFVVRKPAWEAMTHAQREALRRQAGGAVAEVQPLAREEAAMRTLARNGAARVRLTHAGHQAFRAAVQPVLDRWREAIGGDVVDLAEKVVRDATSAQPKAP